MTFKVLPHFNLCHTKLLNCAVSLKAAEITQEDLRLQCEMTVNASQLKILLKIVFWASHNTSIE